MSPVVRSTLELGAPRELVSHGLPLQPPTPTHVFTKDASTYGWVGVVWVGWGVGIVVLCRPGEFPSPFCQAGADLSLAFAAFRPDLKLSTSLSNISDLSSLLTRLMCRWAIIPCWVSGCFATDRKIHLDDLFFLHGIYWPFL